MDRVKVLARLDDLNNKLIEKLGQAGPEQIELISKILSHIAAIRSNLFKTKDEDLAISDERENLYTIIEEFVKLREDLERYRHLSVSDILKFFPETSFPYILPDTLFGHGATESVEVSVGYRRFSESLALAFRLIYPGSLSWRYGTLSWFPAEHWYRQLIDFSESGCEKIIDIDLKSLPEFLRNSLSAYDKIPIFRPKNINLETIAYERDFIGAERFGFAVCTECGGILLNITGRRLVPINLCSCGARREYRKNPPSDYPLIHKIVKFENPVSPSRKADQIFSGLFNSIEFSNNVKVSEFIYGIQRVFEGNVFQKFYNGRFYGDVYETDGLCFKIKDDFLKRLLELTFSSKLSRDFLLLFYFDRLIQQFSASISSWFLIQAVTSCIAVFSEGNSIDTYADVVEAFQGINDRRDDALNMLQELRGEDLSNEQIDNMDEILTYLSSITFEKGAFLGHIKKLFLHSLAHSLKISSLLTLGVSEYDLGYFYDEHLNQIVIFDTVRGGNGCCETLFRKLLSLNLRERLKDIYKMWDTKLEKVSDERKVFAEYVPFPSKDLFSYLEENMESCISATSSSLLYTYLNDVLKLMEDGLKSKEILDNLKDKIGYLNDRVLHDLFAKLQNVEYFKVQRRVMNLEDFFIYRFNPWILFRSLNDSDKGDIYTDYDGSEDSEKRVESIVKSASNVCIDGCPACIYFEGCDMSFLSNFYISRRLLNTAYQIFTEDFLVEVNEKKVNESVQRAWDIVSKNGIVFLRSFSLDSLLRCAANLVGRDAPSGKVCLKGIFSGVQDKRGYLELRLVTVDLEDLGKTEEEHPMVYDTFLTLAELLKAKYGDATSCKIHIIAPWIEDVIFYNGVMGISSNLDIDIFPRDSVRLLDILGYIKSNGGDVKVIALHPENSKWPRYSCDFLILLAERGVEIYLDVKRPFKTHKKFLITSYGVSKGSRNFTNISYYYRDEDAEFFPINTDKYKKNSTIAERTIKEKEYIKHFTAEELKKLRESL